MTRIRLAFVHSGNTPVVLYPVVVLLLLAALSGRLASDAGVRG